MRITSVVLFVVLAYALVVCAWQCDDAYITFRTAKNVWAGHGLTWNPGERVQAYTHPLWMFLSVLVYGVTGELFFSMSALSAGLALLTAAGLVRASAPHRWLGVAALATLAGSKAFIDFSVSGLENPLLSALLVGFVLLLRWEASWRRDLALSLMLSLVFLTRTDAVLLIAPCWLWSLRRTPGALGAVALGAAPAVLWEGFSLFYYGSLVPNTALAKLNLDVPNELLLRQGLVYLADSLRHDPLTLLVTGAALVVALLSGGAPARALAVGGLLYLAYIVRIGGDFMSGRFLVAPLVLALAAGAEALRHRPGPYAPLPALIVAFYALVWPSAPARSTRDYGVGVDQADRIAATGVADERAYYYPFTGVLPVGMNHAALRARGLAVPPYRGALKGQAFAAAPDRVAAYDEVGFFGFHAGDKEIIDVWALCDPLLARIPFRAETFRVGHYPRPIPDGYIESRMAGANQFADAELRAAYDAILLVTRAPLLAEGRMTAILELLTGQHAAAFARAGEG